MLSAAVVLALVALASPTDAQVWDSLTNGTTANISFTPQVDIPGANLSPLQPKTIDQPETFLGNVIVGVYRYGVWLTITAAIFATMLGGLLWLVAGGNASRVDTAKRLITSSIFGLVIALTSYLILQGINPRLLELRLPTIPRPSVEQFTATAGCCQSADGVFRHQPLVSGKCPSSPDFSVPYDPVSEVLCRPCCVCTRSAQQLFGASRRVCVGGKTAEECTQLDQPSVFSWDFVNPFDDGDDLRNCYTAQASCLAYKAWCGQGSYEGYVFPDSLSR